MKWHDFVRRRIPAKSIALIVFDFDGVFTDNKVIVQEDGKEAVVCNRADGLGIGMLRDKNIPLLILSSESNRVVAVRAHKLNLPVMYGVADKKDELWNYCQDRGIDIKKVMYLGNDRNDYEVMKQVGFPVAPRDAHPEIRRIAKYVLRKKGGDGVIKELAEKLFY